VSWNDFFDDIFSLSLSDGQQSSMLRRLDREVNHLRRMERHAQQDGSAARGDLREEIEVLHANFARSLLLLQSLTTLLLRKQLVTREELQAMIQDLDLRDGQHDSALDPAALPGMQSRPTERRSTEGALDDLSRRAALEESTSPREFLKQLENREQPEP
jgi:hypothetical protein